MVLHAPLTAGPWPSGQVILAQSSQVSQWLCAPHTLEFFQCLFRVPLVGWSDSQKSTRVGCPEASTHSQWSKAVKSHPTSVGIQAEILSGSVGLSSPEKGVNIW